MAITHELVAKDGSVLYFHVKGETVRFVGHYCDGKSDDQEVSLEKARSMYRFFRAAGYKPVSDKE